MRVARPEGSIVGDEETESEEEDDTVLYSTVDLCVMSSVQQLTDLGTGCHTGSHGEITWLGDTLGSHSKSLI